MYQISSRVSISIGDVPINERISSSDSEIRWVLQQRIVLILNILNHNLRSMTILLQSLSSSNHGRRTSCLLLVRNNNELEAVFRRSNIQITRQR